jgi:hypothetical protein
MREEDGSWRKLNNDELHDLYSSPNIARVIKSRRMRWAGHVGGPKARDHWEDLGIGGKIILRWTYGDRDRCGELDSAGSGYGPVAGFCEHGDEPSGSIRKQDIFDKLSDNQIFR